MLCTERSEVDMHLSAARGAVAVQRDMFVAGVTGRVEHLERARELPKAALDAAPAAGLLLLLLLLLLRLAALALGPGLGLCRCRPAAADGQLALLLLRLHLQR